MPSTATTSVRGLIGGGLSRHVRRAGGAIALLVAVIATLDGAQARYDVKELAEFRLTTPAFQRFADASRRIAVVVEGDAALRATPLFTHEVAIQGDALEMASALDRRLRTHPELSAALRAARTTPREFTTFALALVAARLAHGFVESGAMRRVPPGAPTDNVAFVEAHRAEVASVLKVLAIEGPGR
ncbi:MAG: hypothetical protein ACT4QD_19170 [Acidobacteriota bacterium]